MALAALPLIKKRLVDAVYGNSKVPPRGWRRLITLEGYRPDGFPALTFVHFKELPV